MSEKNIFQASAEAFGTKPSLDEASWAFKDVLERQSEQRDKSIKEAVGKGQDRLTQEFIEQQKNKALTKEKILEAKNYVAEERRKRQSSTSSIHGVAPQVPQTQLQKLKFKRMEDLIKSYDSFMAKKNKERLSSMSEESKVAEIEVGGVFRSSGELKTHLFVDNFMDHLTLGLVKPSDRIAAYGDTIKRVNPGIVATSAIAGELSAFYALYGVSALARVPKAIAAVTKKSDTAASIVRGFGFLPNKMASLKNLNASTAYILRQPTTFEKGSQAIVNVVINGAVDTAKAMTGKYLRDNELTQKEWEGTLNHTAEGMFRGYGMSMINAPSNMAFRVMADLAFSAGQQGYNIAVGRQQGWDKGQVLQDFWINMLIGEGVLQKFYKMTRSQLESRANKSANTSHLLQLIDGDEYFSSYKDGWKADVLEGMNSTALEMEKANGMPNTDEIRKSIYEIHKAKEVNVLNEARNRTGFSHFYDTTSNDYMRVSAQEVFKPMEVAGFKAPADPIKTLKSKASFIKYLKEQGVDITKSVEEPGLPPINTDEFRGIFSELIDKNKLSINADDLFEGVDSLIARRPLSFGSEDTGSFESVYNLLKNENDYAILNKILNKNKITDRNAYVSVYEWINEPKNKSFIDQTKASNDDATAQNLIYTRAVQDFINNPNVRRIDAGEKLETPPNLHAQSNQDLSHLTDLIIHASRDQESQIDTIAYFFKHFHNDPTDSQIAEALQSMGFNRTTKEVGDMIERVRLNIGQHKLKTSDPIIDSILKEWDMPAAKKMTDKEVDLLYRNKRARLSQYDPDVSIKRKLPTGDAGIIKKGGAYIFDLDEVFLSTKVVTDEQTAKRVINVIKNTINENVRSFNKRSQGMSKDAVSRIEIVSPNESRVVIYGKNINGNHVDAFAKDILNLLRGKYNRIPDNYRRSFNVRIPSEDGNTHVNGFDSVRMAYAKSTEQIAAYGDIRDIILSKMQQINPDSFVYKNTHSHIMDMSDMSFGKLRDMFLTGDLSNEQFIDAVQGSKLFQSFPEIFPAIAKKKEKVKNAELLGMDDDQISKSTFSEDIAIDSQNIGSSVEMSYAELYKKVSKRNLSIIDEVNLYDVPIEASNNIKNKVFDKAKKIIIDLEKEEFEQLGFFSKVRTKIKEKGVFGKITQGTKDFLDDNFDVYSKDPNHILVKNLIQGSFADKDALSYDVTTYVADVYEGILGRMFPVKSKDREIRVSSMSNILHFIREKELKVLFDAEGNVNKGILEDLEKSIKWSDKNKAEDNFNSIKDSVESGLSAKLLSGYAKATSDPLAFSKLAIRLLDVKAGDVLTLVKRDNSLFTELVQPLWLMGGKRKGAYLNLDNMERFKEKIRERLVATLEEFRPEIMQGLMNRHTQLGSEAGTTAEFIGNLLEKNGSLSNQLRKEIKDGTLFYKVIPNKDEALRLQKRFEKILDGYQETDFANLSYVFHSVLGDPSNQIVMRNIIARMAGDTAIKIHDPSDPEGGRTRLMEQELSIREKDMDISIDAFLGRSNPTTEQLVEMGYDVGINHVNNVAAQVRYLFQKEYNFNMGKSMKDRFFRKMAEGYDQIDSLKKRMVQVRKSKSPTDNDAVVKFEKMSAIMEKERMAWKEFLRYIGQHGGYFYRPTSAELSDITFQINSLTKSKNDLPAEGSQAVKESLNENLKRLIKTKNDMEWMISIYSGDAVVSSYDNLIRYLKETNDERIKKKYGGADHIRELKRQSNLVREDFVNEFVYTLYGSVDPSDIKRNPFMPIDASSHNNPDDYMYRVNKKTKSRVMSPFIDNTRTSISRGVAGSRYEIQSAPTAPGFEGIYMQRTGMEGLRQFLFRNSMTPNREGYDGLKQVQNMYDQTNSYLKRITLWQPTIMLWNDLAQGIFIRNPFTISAYSSFIEAKNIMFMKGDKGSIEADKYHRFDQSNLFNKSAGFPEMQNNSIMTTTDFLLKDDKLGVVKYLEALNVKSGLSAEAARAKAENEQWPRFKANMKMGYNGAMLPLKFMQEKTWAIDEWLRLSHAIPMQKKFEAYLSKTYQEKGIANWKAKAEADSYRQASDYVNTYMVEYSRLPNHTRKFMNRIFMYPTYRVGTLRIYKKMLMDASKGVKRLFGYDPDNKYIVSDDRWEQAMFELAPLFRAVVAKAAVKTMAVMFFGAGYGSIMEAMTEYRGRREEGEGFFNQKMGVISFGTPLFDLEKIITRDFSQTLKYNTAAFPGLAMALYNNTHPITGKPLWTSDPKKNPAEASAQLGASLFFWYTPFMPDFRNWGEDEKSLGLEILTKSGLAFYYNPNNPREALRDFKKAVNEAKTPEQRNKAYRAFQRRMNHIRNQWQPQSSKEEQTLLNLETGGMLLGK